MTTSRTVDPSVSRTPIPSEASDLATVCVLCSHNCGLRVDVEDGRITAVRPDDRNPITEGYICNKGVTVPSYVEHAQRVQHPMRRRADGSFERVSWETAIGEIAAKLASLRDEHGPRAIGLVGIGGQANHLDAPYGTSFLRAIGSRRFFNPYAQEKTQHNLLDHWMFDAAPVLMLHPDQENTRFLLVMGTNPRITNRGPNATETFKKLAKKDSCKVVVVDPRETETTRGADRHLKVRPGSDAYLLLGIAAVQVQNELYDAEFVGGKTVGFNEVRDVLVRIDVPDMAERCGIDAATLTEVATEFATTEGASIMYDLGVEQTRFSTLISYLIRLNITLSGNMQREGGNLFIEGFSPPSLSRNRHAEPERALVSGIQAVRALGNFSMFSPTLFPEEVLNDHPERLRAAIVEGSNPLLSFSDSNRWKKAVDRLDLLVVIDPAFTETAREADYVLPVPCGYEKWEIALFPKRHPEIHAQLRPPVVAGPQEALTEAEIYIRLAEEMGIVEPLPDELAEVGRTEGPDSRAAFVAAAMGLAAETAAKGIDGETQFLTWAYRGIGHHFEAPSLVAVWGLCQENAMKRHGDVIRTLGKEWADRNPLELGEEIFRLLMAHPEGVEVARVKPDVSLDDYLGYEDKQVRLAPEAMIAEMERALATRVEPDPAYPFILAAGVRTRWTANTIQRNPAWRKGSGPHCPLYIAPQDAAGLGIAKGDRVRLETSRGAVELSATIDPKVQDGYLWMPNGFGVAYSESLEGPYVADGANANELTDTEDRDPITGCPHHRYVSVRLTRVEPESAAA